MYISEQTISELGSMGIYVRWYPEETYEEFKKNQWEKEYKRWFEYSKSECKELNPPKNDGSYESWSFETLAEYEEHIKEFCDRIIDRHCDPYEYTTLYIRHDGEQMMARKENVKSKCITTEYVLNLVEKDRKVYTGTYGQFALAMQKLCKENGLAGSFMVYPTTYGIGIWAMYNWDFEKDVRKVESILKERGVEYRNEYSDQRWAYRFRISKKSANMKLL